MKSTLFIINVRTSVNQLWYHYSYSWRHSLDRQFFLWIQRYFLHLLMTIMENMFIDKNITRFACSLWCNPAISMLIPIVFLKTFKTKITVQKVFFNIRKVNNRSCSTWFKLWIRHISNTLNSQYSYSSYIKYRRFSSCADIR